MSDRTDGRRPRQRGKKVIFRPWVHDPKTGEIRWAKQYGKKAFPIYIDE